MRMIPETAALTMGRRVSIGNYPTMCTFRTSPDGVQTALPAIILVMSVSSGGYAKEHHEIAELPPTGEARLSRRFPTRCWATISYDTEDGRRKMITGRVVNMSAMGVLMEALRRPPVGTQVRIQANELLVGTAFVRRSAWGSWRFRIGLEFAKAIRNRY